MGVKITMDLYAYSQIDKLKKYLEENNIDIPRLRGLRLMKDEKPVSEDEIKECVKSGALQARKQCDIFNKYVGKNVLYVHARVGGANWDFFGMDEITKHPLYLERVDDYFDSTYCDIYFKLKDK